jgi:hypothetical protein
MLKCQLVRTMPGEFLAEQSGGFEKPAPVRLSADWRSSALSGAEDSYGLAVSGIGDADGERGEGGLLGGARALAAVTWTWRADGWHLRRHRCLAAADNCHAPGLN